MESPSFVVRLADLERGPRTVTFTLSEAWLTRELSDAQAVPLAPGTATVELMKSGGTVIVRGKADVRLTVPCVVTLDPVPFELKPEIFLELSREPETYGKAPAAKAGAKASKDAAFGAGASKAHAKARGRTERHGRGKDDDELTAEEAATDTYKGEEIVLDGFFREFLLLEIPPYPRRSDLPSAEESLSSRPLAGPPGEAKPLDPRLAPLLGLANRLRGERDKE
ncbi:MAG TPA: hypothetical protein VFV94_02885 [Polyangiaceae bacterium]|jgi:uncharacterized metal-binding protein YceD (DUF177 family)|nr:hypothetical protein [Polyangiaceae bacterium]